MFTERKAGVLLNPTCFPGKYGIGDLGNEAYKFIDFLVKSRQSFWQILPLTSTTYSPYEGLSAFGSSHLLISPEKLKECGLLSSEELKEFEVKDDSSVDYKAIFEKKFDLLLKAFSNFKLQDTPSLVSNFQKFCAENSDWLDEYSFFMSLKCFFIRERKLLQEKNENSAELISYIEETSAHMDAERATEFFYGGAWASWDPELKKREPESMIYYKNLLFSEIQFHKFCQFIFNLQWNDLKSYANDKGIKIIGDVPIFLSYDCADVWANKDLFLLDEEGYPTVVSGAPPDYFSEDGQLWGGPIYNWARHKETNYEWWTKRIKSSLKLVDALRIDHFRGFEAYWETRYGEKTARSGKWVKGPDRDFFSHLSSTLGKLPLIAEDLGIITPDVEFLRDFFDIPGISIIQFGFDGTETNPYLPENIMKNKIVYTGTHDNNTTVGWYNSLDEHTKESVKKYINVDESNLSYSFIETAYRTLANTVIIPLQDVLELDESHRMNVPGKIENNWSWRFKKSMLNDTYADKLAGLVEKYKRS